MWLFILSSFGKPSPLAPDFPIYSLDPSYFSLSEPIPSVYFHFTHNLLFPITLHFTPQNSSIGFQVLLQFLKALAAFA